MGVDYLIRNCDQRNPATRGVLEDVSDAVNRADAIVRDLLNLSRPGSVALQPEDLHEVIDSVLSLVRHEITRNNVTVTREFSSQDTTLLCDRAKITQVLVNLCTNACHAMETGGTLTVRTRTRAIDPEDFKRAAGSRQAIQFQPGDTVIEIEIDDTGPGIPEENLGKLFVPFFTTKPTGLGTGLGLTTARKIVESHGGAIRLQNRPDRGLRVTLHFKT